eukprot:scaffold616_cov306-Pavlova_lutheri.AAC.30
MGNRLADVASRPPPCHGNGIPLVRQTKRRCPGQKAATQRKERSCEAGRCVRKRDEKAAAARNGEQIAHGKSDGDGSGAQKVSLIE